MISIEEFTKLVRKEMPIDFRGFAKGQELEDLCDYFINYKEGKECIVYGYKELIDKKYDPEIKAGMVASLMSNIY